MARTQPKPKPIEDVYLTVDATADRMQIHRAGVYRHMADPVDPLPYKVVGRRRRVKLSELDAWMERQRVVYEAEQAAQREAVG